MLVAADQSRRGDLSRIALVAMKRVSSMDFGGKPASAAELGH